jgi:cell division protein FtsA
VSGRGRESWGRDSRGRDRGWLAAGLKAHQAVGLLDLGTSKTACLIVVPARAAEDGAGAQVRALGAGVAPTRGLSDGRIVSLDAAEQAVRAAVDEAERTAGVTVEDVVIAVAGGDLRLQRFTARTHIEGGAVGATDIARTMLGARSYAERGGRAPLHLACHGYELDGAADIADPEGLAGQRLGVDLGAVTTAAAPLSNLLHVVERAYLRPVLVAPAPCAAALATTSAAERTGGVIAADLGAGGTSLALLVGGYPAAIAALPVGGDHITRDLAQAFSLPMLEAERIKRACPSVAEGAAGEPLPGRPMTVAAGGQADGDEPAENCPPEPPAAQALRPGAAENMAQVRDVVRERLVDLVRRIIEATRDPRDNHHRPYIVLSGGASRQEGFAALAAMVADLPVRAAHLSPVVGLPAEFAGLEFAVVRGLAEVACDPAMGMRVGSGSAPARGYLRRVGQWLQESF